MVLDAKRPRCPVTLCETQRSEKCIPKGHVQMAAHDGVPRALTRARGGHDDQGSGSYDDGSSPLSLDPSSLCETAANTTEGEKKNNRKNRPEHPCRLASRKKTSEGASSLKPRKVPRESENRKNTPERHPDKTPERKDARPERVISQARRGQKGKRKRTKKMRCGVSPVTT